MKAKIIIIILLALALAVAPAHAKKKNKQKELPPGLEKNLKRGNSLPPGWQKKIAQGKILEKELYLQGQIIVPLDPLGIVTIRIEDKVLRVHEKTMEIIDILSE